MHAGSEVLYNNSEERDGIDEDWDFFEEEQCALKVGCALIYFQFCVVCF
jgi:hypothetical protein